MLKLLDNLRLERTVAVLREGIEAGHYFGGQLYLSLNGEIIADSGFGNISPSHIEAKSSPISPSHLMLLLSSAKPVTAVAVAQQYEKQKLHWDDPVSELIPEFAVNGKERITIRHLLTHTAGFRSADRVAEDLPWDDVIREICAAPLESGWEPGKKAGYQISSSWFILAEIVSRVTSRAFPDYLRSNIFVPLGMANSWIGMPPEAFDSYGSLIAPMYSTDITPPRPVSLWNTEKGCALCRPGSNGRGPAHDLGRFYEALLRPDTVPLLEPETIQEMTQRQRTGMFDETFRHIMDWGLGFIINSNRYGAETVPYGYGRHASDQAFGHSGAQSSCAFADPADDLVVIWILNGMPGERPHRKRSRELNTAIYEDLGLQRAT